MPSKHNNPPSWLPSLLGLLLAAALAGCDREPVKTVVLSPPAGTAEQATSPASAPQAAVLPGAPAAPPVAVAPPPGATSLPAGAASPPSAAAAPPAQTPAAPAAASASAPTTAGPLDAAPVAAAPRAAASAPQARSPGEPPPPESVAPVAKAPGAMMPAYQGPLGDPEGARLLAARPLLVPVAGVPPTTLADHYRDRRGDRVHEAMDIMATRGTPVVAVDDGHVAKLFTSRGGGLTVYHFDPSQRLAYYYAHLDRYAEGLKEGSPVRRGQVIGYVGFTGNANEHAPHLHFAVFRLGADRRWWEGEPVNPYPAFRHARPAELVAAR
jgi:murein DD-endopeptidase MepM/ murein hydrolase activator NlpD